MLATAINHEKVLLQTARVNIWSQERSRSISCKIILDTGSPRSYVTKKATELIEAQIHHQETTNRDVIQVNFSRASTVINLNAISVERICLPVRNQSKFNLVKALPDVVINNLADGAEEDQADIIFLSVWIITGILLKVKLYVKRTV